MIPFIPAAIAVIIATTLNIIITLGATELGYGILTWQFWVIMPPTAYFIGVGVGATIMKLYDKHN